MLHRIAALLVPCLVCAILPAQEFRATISGHVFDSSGAAVRTARIQAVNVKTYETTNAITDHTGAYTVPLLRPGRYKMVVSAAGFKQRVREGVVLKATKAKVAGIDITLEVGAVTETADGTTKTRTVGVVTTAPGPVGLVSPVNYAIIGSGSTATVTWHAATDAEFYDIYLGVVSQSMSQVGHVAAPTTQFTVGVLSSTSYSWCVVATNTAGSSTSCSNFTTPPSGWFSGQ